MFDRKGAPYRKYIEKDVWVWFITYGRRDEKLSLEKLRGIDISSKKVRLSARCEEQPKFVIETIAKGTAVIHKLNQRLYGKNLLSCLRNTVFYNFIIKIHNINELAVF